MCGLIITHLKAKCWRSILDLRTAIIIIPRSPLTAGSSYTISITANGQTYTENAKEPTHILARRCPQRLTLSIQARAEKPMKLTPLTEEWYDWLSKKQRAATHPAEDHSVPV
jgi:hypothetical protein